MCFSLPFFPLSIQEPLFCACGTSGCSVNSWHSNPAAMQGEGWQGALRDGAIRREGFWAREAMKLCEGDESHRTADSGKGPQNPSVSIPAVGQQLPGCPGRSSRDGASCCVQPPRGGSEPPAQAGRSCGLVAAQLCPGVGSQHSSRFRNFAFGGRADKHGVCKFLSCFVMLK